jgi:hypothetical protein
VLFRSIWGAATNAIRKELKKGWIMLHETEIAKTHLRFQKGESGARRPDGIIFNRAEKKCLIVDFTRGGGSTKGELDVIARRKGATYALLMLDLQDSNIEMSIEFKPLVCTYNGAIAEGTWLDALRYIDIPSNKCVGILTQVVRETCIALTRMANVRSQALREQAVKP